jgi:hypothetical protein
VVFYPNKLQEAANRANYLRSKAYKLFFSGVSSKQCIVNVAAIAVKDNLKM